MLEIVQVWDLLRYKAPGNATRLHTVRVHEGGGVGEEVYVLIFDDQTRVHACIGPI